MESFGNGDDSAASLEIPDRRPDDSGISMKTELNSPTSAESTKVPLEESNAGSSANLGSTTIMGQSALSFKDQPMVTNLKGDVCYTWKNLSVEVRMPKKWGKDREEPVHKTILHDSVGCLKSGEIWALMGSSGAGKTTLLNTLNFRSSRALHVRGERRINGSPVSPEIISSISAYVEQDDLLFPRLTVKEHLNFYASLRLPPHMSTTERRERVHEILQELGLWNIRDHQIGSPTTFKGISGGEKKRLAFASEILTDPNILFCDEPTSGLDSFMARHVVQIMHKMAARGKIIICTIHQPSSEIFHMFDYLYLLTEGRVAYAGRSGDAPEFFASQGHFCPSTHNPADFFLRALAIVPDRAEECKRHSAFIADAFEQTRTHAAYVKQASINRERDTDLEIIEKQRKRAGRYNAGNITQLSALIKRSLICTVREPNVFSLKLIQHIILGLALGMVFYKSPYDVEGAVSISGCIIMCVMGVNMLPVFAVITTFSDEIPIFLREHWGGMYRCWTYYLARSCVDLPFYLFYPWIFFPQIFWLVGMTLPYTRIIHHCLTLSAVAACGVSYGYIAACWSKDIKMVLQIIPSILLPTLIFSGFFLDEHEIFSGITWLKYLSVIYYGTENLMLQQWETVEDVYQTEPFVPELFRDGHGVIEFYNYTEGRYHMNYVGMVGLFISYRIIAFIGLWMKTRR